MANRAGIHAVRSFWEQVWQSPQNYDAIDELVVEDFVLISGGQRFAPDDASADHAGLLLGGWRGLLRH